MANKKTKTQEIRSITEEYDFYVKKVYPNGMTTSQAEQVRQAFFAGALIAFEKVFFVGTLKVEEDTAIKVLNDLKSEVDNDIMMGLKSTLQ